MFPNSIRWRLNLWLGFLLLCVLSGFGITIYQLQRINQLNQIDEDLKTRVNALSSAVRGGNGPPPEFGPGRRPFDNGAPDTEGESKPPRERDGSRAPFGQQGGRPPGRGGPFGGQRGGRPGFRDVTLSSAVRSLFDETQTNGPYFSIWFFDDTPAKHSANAPADLEAPTRFKNDTSLHNELRGIFREAHQFTEMGDCILVGKSTVPDFRELHRFGLIVLGAGVGILAFGLGIGWWLTTRAIRPVEEISAAAARISAGNLSERVTVGDPSNELGRLAAVLNSTFARLESAFAQQKQFTADASHELRTPIAVIIAEAQTTLARERNAAEYRETVEACLDAAQQMRRLAQSLLELSRFDAGQENIERMPFDLASQVRAAVELVRPLAKERGIEIHCDLAPAETLGDADRINQVITNLLTNAIHYNKERGEIRVTTRVDNGRATLTVTDTGQGISQEDLPHIFERFYRADKARARAQGQSGLGLAIGKAIVDAHGGSIEVTSQPGEGTAFTVRLPGS